MGNPIIMVAYIIRKNWGVIYLKEKIMLMFGGIYKNTHFKLRVALSSPKN